MPNHIHLIGQADEADGLAKFMQCLNRSYTAYFNEKYKMVGHLWQGRFKSKIISKDEYAINCVNYIEKIDIEDDFQIDMGKLRQLGELAPILGCNAVRIFSYYNRENRPADRWRAESLDRLRRLRDLAGEVGLVLYHENESGIYGDACERVLVILNSRRRTTS